MEDKVGVGAELEDTVSRTERLEPLRLKGRGSRELTGWVLASDRREVGKDVAEPPRSQGAVAIEPVGPGLRSAVHNALHRSFKNLPHTCAEYQSRAACSL